MKNIVLVFLLGFGLILLVWVIEIVNIYDCVNNVQVFVYQMQFVVVFVGIQGIVFCMIGMDQYEQVIIVYEIMMNGLVDVYQKMVESYQKMMGNNMVFMIVLLMFYVVMNEYERVVVVYEFMNNG